MTDINSAPPPHTTGKKVVPAERVQGGSDRLVEIMELLFFAYRDFTGEADAILAEIGFGRAHHRVLHFVNRRPGLRVADLLDILRITKQSLARVLNQLVDDDCIDVRSGEADRRERRLYPTAKGADIAMRLAALQTRRIRSALDDAGLGAEEPARRFLSGMIAATDREAVIRLIEEAGRATARPRPA